MDLKSMLNAMYRENPPQVMSGAAVDQNGESHELVLYKFDTCPYCQRVMQFVQQIQVPMTFKDIHQDSGALQELLTVGGKRQVPCLFIDGKPLYESLDINRYLEENYA